MGKNEVYKKLKDILINSDKPSIEIIEMVNNGEMDGYPFNMIVKLKNIDQNKKFHKEGNVFNHTMLVIDKASKLKDNSNDIEILMISALLHDIGKLTTTAIRKGRITSYNHDVESSKMVYDFLEDVEDDAFIKKVSKLTLYHMQSLYYKSGLKFFDEKGIKENVDINELILLTISDRTGRLEIDEYGEIYEIKKFENYLRDLKS